MQALIKSPAATATPASASNTRDRSRSKEVRAREVAEKKQVEEQQEAKLAKFKETTSDSDKLTMIFEKLCVADDRTAATQSGMTATKPNTIDNFKEIKHEHQQLKQRMVNLESKLATGSNAKEFEPSDVRFTDLCKWDTRRKEGITRQELVQFLPPSKTFLPQELHEHIGDPEVKQYRNAKFQLSTHPKFTQEIEDCIRSTWLIEEHIDWKGNKTYISAERSSDSHRNLVLRKDF